MPGSNFPDRMRVADKNGEMTPEFRRWLDDALAQRNPVVSQPAKEAGTDFSGDLAGKTTTVVNGVIVTVV